VMRKYLIFVLLGLFVAGTAFFTLQSVFSPAQITSSQYWADLDSAKISSILIRAQANEAIVTYKDGSVRKIVWPPQTKRPASDVRTEEIPEIIIEKASYWSPNLPWLALSAALLLGGVCVFVGLRARRVT